MKQLVTGIILFLSFSAFADLELSGIYQGKNLYVQNPYTPDMKSYCTQEVYVNDIKMMQAVSASAFEIDLSFLTINAPVRIRITHRSDCSPKILNPGVVQVKTNFSFSAVNIEDKLVSWSAKNEKPKGRYFIERFEFNHWRTISEIYSQNKDRYESQILHNSGLNRYRIRYVEDNGNSNYSDVIEYQSKQETITFYPKRVTDFLTLSRDADYEILDKFGNVIKRGHKKEIDLSQLHTEVYYLNVDNRTFKFFKK
jgi:hypothetical protein